MFKIGKRRVRLFVAPNSSMMPALKRIGILGGSSQEATAIYYRRINDLVNERLGGWNSAEIIISSMNFQRSVDAITTDEWDVLATYLTQRAKALKLAGADVLICASNTLHKLADRFTAGLDIPFIHVVDPTAEAIRRKQLSRVALFGTLTVMEEDFLKERYRSFGVEVVVPSADERRTIDRIIFDELCKGRVQPQSKALFLRIADTLRRKGAEGLILGCTEIPMLVCQADRPDFPMFDTVELHARAAVAFALSDFERPNIL